MSYVYKVEIRLATTQKKFNLKDKHVIINDAVQRYNNRSYEMQNPKTLALQEINDDNIFLILESSLPLNSLGRALRTFSVIIIKEIKDEDFINAITANGQLFSTRQLGKNKKEISIKSHIDYAQIEDLDVIKSLMDYVYKKRDPDSTTYRKKKAAFEQIKKIAFDSGIINIGVNQQMGR